MEQELYLLLNIDNCIGLGNCNLIPTSKSNIVDGVKILQEKAQLKRIINYEKICK